MKKALLPLFFTLFFQCFTSGLLSKSYGFISEIHIIGNNKTKDVIILRELPFKRGDIIDMAMLESLMEQGRNNVRNLSLFNFVYVSHISDFDKEPEKYSNIEIVISVNERWYHFPLMGISLEDRNLSSWLKNPNWNKVTTDVGFKIYNMWGKNQTLTAAYIFGYNNGFRFEYSNIYIDIEGRHLLDISVSRQYSRTVNTLSLLDKPKYIKSDSLHLENAYQGTLTYTYRPQIRLRNRFTLQYEISQIDSLVLINNIRYWGDSQLNRRAVTLIYGLTFDQRDNIQYPLYGYYFNLQLKGYTNSDLSIKYGQIKGDFQYYGSFSERLSLSARLQWGLSAKNVEGYIFDKAIGYDEVFLRGYEFYVADGQHYATISPTVRYKIVPTTIYILKFLSFLPKFNRLHLTVFGKSYFDAGYSYHKYQNSVNTLSNRILLSWGVGVDIVSYYDLTFSFDYSFNQLKERGLFISVKKPLH